VEQQCARFYAEKMLRPSMAGPIGALAGLFDKAARTIQEPAAGVAALVESDS